MKKVVLAVLSASFTVASSTQSVAQKPIQLGTQPQTTTPTTAAPASAVQMGSKPQTTTPTVSAPASAVRLGTAPAPVKAVAGAAVNPCAVGPVSTGLPVVSLGSGVKPTGPAPMSEAEYKAYTDAANLKDPKAQAAAFEAYLEAYPNSSVKNETLQQTMYLYSGLQDSAKTLAMADKLLAADPCNFYAEIFEVQLNRSAGEDAKDPSAKQAGLDKAKMYALQGLAAPKPKKTAPADWEKMKQQGYPIFYSAIATADLNKKDNAGAIKAFQSELASVPVSETITPGLELADTFYLAQAYYTGANPDYLMCAYYGARGISYAPADLKSAFSDVGKYCYQKYHGGADGFDAVIAIAKDNLNPPAGFAASIKPAPTALDTVKSVIDTTPDLTNLALTDKMFLLVNGNVMNPATKQTYSDQVFAANKGKAVQIEDATVVSATESTVSLAVSPEAVAGKTAEFVVTMKEPLKAIPAEGAKISLIGTFTSYTLKPLSIAVGDAEVVVKAVKPVAKAPVRRSTPKK